jgi:hypothetical protein
VTSFSLGQLYDAQDVALAVFDPSPLVGSDLSNTVNGLETRLVVFLEDDPAGLELGKSK